MVVISISISLFLPLSPTPPLYFSTSPFLPRLPVSPSPLFYLVTAVVSVRSEHIVCVCAVVTYTYEDGNQSPAFVKEREEGEDGGGREGKEGRKELCEYMSAQHIAHSTHHNTTHHTPHHSTRQHTTHDTRHRAGFPPLSPSSLLLSSPSSDTRVPDTPITAVSTRRRSISTASKNQYLFLYDS